jgi:hypothetical protein
MYVRHHNAAVHIEDTPNKQTLASEPANRYQTASAQSTILWSDRPFTVTRGRLIGVKRTGQNIEVALIANGTTSLTWLAANSLLTQSQINRWLSSSSFHTK